MPERGANTLTAPEYVSIAYAAEQVLDCHHSTVRKMIAKGELKAYRVGRLIRIKRSDLEKQLKPVTGAAAYVGGGAVA